jgi:hypothetical protein
MHSKPMKGRLSFFENGGYNAQGKYDSAIETKFAKILKFFDKSPKLSIRFIIFIIIPLIF